MIVNVMDIVSLARIANVLTPMTKLVARHTIKLARQDLLKLVLKILFVRTNFVEMSPVSAALLVVDPTTLLCLIVLVSLACVATLAMIALEYVLSDTSVMTEAVIA